MDITTYSTQIVLIIDYNQFKKWYNVCENKNNFTKEKLVSNFNDVIWIMIQDWWIQFATLRKENYYT